jgi:hypothetical protein
MGAAGAGPRAARKQPGGVCEEARRTRVADSHRPPRAARRRRLRGTLGEARGRRLLDPVDRRVRRRHRPGGSRAGAGGAGLGTPTRQRRPLLARGALRAAGGGLRARCDGLRTSVDRMDGRSGAAGDPLRRGGRHTGSTPREAAMRATHTPCPPGWKSTCSRPAPSRSRVTVSSGCGAKTATRGHGSSALTRRCSGIGVPRS